MRQPLLSMALAAGLLGSAAAGACPDPADVTGELQRLIEEARSAETFRDGHRISGAMWEVWLRAPDEAAQEVLDAGMRRRDVADYLGAIEQFDRLAAYCPTYAEGFNQRAFVNFLRGDFESALVDLDIALELQPLHVAAQSGRALTLMNLGRLEEARSQLLSAVALNAWLSEKVLLSDGAPLGLPGEEL